MILTKEQYESFKKAKSAEEIIEFAKKENMELNIEEANSIYNKINFKFAELDDDELEGVAGGVLNAGFNKGNYNKNLYSQIDPFNIILR